MIALRNFSPDPASLKAGQGLASVRKWVTLGHDDSFLWGECQGSGSKPYQTQIDLGEAASKCSCPSPKIPLQTCPWPFAHLCRVGRWPGKAVNAGLGSRVGGAPGGKGKEKAGES